MILLVGTKRFDLRVVPWVSLAVATLVFVVWFLAESPLRPEPPSRVEAAVSYWTEHAYLAAEPEVLIAAGGARLPDERLAYFKELQSQAYSRFPASDEDREAEQAQLDQLTSLAMATAKSVTSTNAWLPTQPKWKGLGLFALLHPNVASLLLCLGVFLVFGGLLESGWGRARFVPFLLGATLFSAAAYAVLVPFALAPLWGLHAPSAGLLGALLMLRRDSPIPLGMPGAEPKFVVPVWGLIPLLLVVDGVLFLQHGVPGFAYQAQFLTLGAGLAAGFWIPKPAARPVVAQEEAVEKAEAASVAVAEVPEAPQPAKRAEPARHTEEKIEPPAAEPSLLKRVHEARGRGDNAAAFKLLRGEIANSSDPEIAMVYWDVAVAEGHPDIAARVLLRITRECVGSGDLSGAARCWLCVAKQMPDARLTADIMIKLAPALATLRERDAALNVLGKLAAPGAQGLDGAIAVKAMKLATEWKQDELALELAKTGLALPGIQLADASRLQALVDEHAPPEAVIADDPIVEEVVEETDDAEEILDSGAELPDPEPQEVEPATSDPDLERIALLPSDSERIEEARQEDHLAGVMEGVAPCEEDPEDEDEPAFLADSADVVVIEPEDELPETPEPVAVAEAEPEAEPDDKSEPSFSIVDADVATDDDLPQISSAVLPNFPSVKVKQAIATQLGEKCIALTSTPLSGAEIGVGEDFEISYGEIQAVSAAGVQGEAELPVVLIDLILNWNDAGRGPLEVVRLRGDEFDPRTVVGDGVSHAEAYRAFLGELIGAASPVLLPNEESARGQRMRMFASVAAYEREVLDVELPDNED